MADARVGPRRAGQAEGFLAGLHHPISGLDHVLAMVSVGLWGAQLGAPAVWLLPVTFPMVMAFGGMLGLIGVRAARRRGRHRAVGVLLGVVRARRERGRRSGWRRRSWASSRSSTVTPTAPSCRRRERPALQRRLRGGDRVLHAIGIAIGVIHAGAGAASRCASRGRSWRSRAARFCGERWRDRPPRVLAPLTAILALALLPSPAEAHLVTTVGPVYDGISHVFMSPDDLVPILAMAMLAGLNGPAAARLALFAMTAAWLAGGALGFIVGHPTSSIATTASFLVLGALTAADADHRHVWSQSSRSLAVACTVGSTVRRSRKAGRDPTGLLGIGASTFVIVALMAALVVSLRLAWMRIAVRVAGSWVAAIGLLMLGWSLRVR